MKKFKDILKEASKKDISGILKTKMKDLTSGELEKFLNTYIPKFNGITIPSKKEDMKSGGYEIYKNGPGLWMIHSFGKDDAENVRNLWRANDASTTEELLKQLQNAKVELKWFIPHNKMAPGRTIKRLYKIKPNGTTSKRKPRFATDEPW